VKNKMMNRKYVSGLLTALGIATVSLGSLITMTQPALAEHRWVSGSNGSVPSGAIQVGNDGADPLYACKAYLGNGKLHPRNGRCFVPYGGKEEAYRTYEVLVGNNLRWVPLKGSAPQYAVVGGAERNGTPLYVCRANLRSGVTPGKYNAVNNICYLPYGGRENEIRSGEILVELVGSSPSISGEVTFTDVSQTSTQCKDFKVNLTSIAQSPPPPDSLLNISSPIFNYSEPMSGDIKTGKCNYSIKAFSIDAGKKAMIGLAGSQTNNVTIPTRKPIKMNFKAVFLERPIIN
jgi:Protein of unknown function (DUF3421)